MSSLLPCVIYSQNKTRLEHLERQGYPHPTGGESFGGDCCIYYLVAGLGCHCILQVKPVISFSEVIISLAFYRWVSVVISGHGTALKVAVSAIAVPHIAAHLVSSPKRAGNLNWRNAVWCLQRQLKLGFPYYLSYSSGSPFQTCYTISTSIVAC